MSATTVSPSTTTTSYGKFRLWHMFCPCDMETTMCGKPYPGATGHKRHPAGQVCLVCADMMPLPCPKCGGAA